MNIKKGQKFLCKETVVMNHTGEMVYIKGKTYPSEQDGCITNEVGYIGHSWDWDTDFDRHFELLEEEAKESLDEQLLAAEKESDFMQIARGLAGLLEYKNKQYGNSALNPINVFAGKSKVGYRADDKISRIRNSEVLRKNDVTDLMGYLILICKENGWLTFDEFKD